MLVENWKRVYSNEESPASLDFFKKNFDPKGFSIWRVDYKYNDGQLNSRAALSTSKY